MIVLAVMSVLIYYSCDKDEATWLPEKTYTFKSIAEIGNDLTLEAQERQNRFDALQKVYPVQGLAKDNIDTTVDAAVLLHAAPQGSSQNVYVVTPKIAIGVAGWYPPCNSLSMIVRWDGDLTGGWFDFDIPNSGMINFPNNSVLYNMTDSALYFCFFALNPFPLSSPYRAICSFAVIGTHGKVWVDRSQPHFWALGRDGINNYRTFFVNNGEITIQ